MSDEFEPRIVGFLCNWCSYSTADDTAGTTRQPVPPFIRVIKVTCTGRVDPLFLITAYLRGADGVLVVGCWPGQCHYKEGNYHADADRLRIEWVSDSEAWRLAEIATEFEQRIKQQGLNAVRSEIFC